jgi:hypothetical protein
MREHVPKQFKTVMTGRFMLNRQGILVGLFWDRLAAIPEQ